MKHNPRCAIFHDPPSLQDPSDCNCGAIPPLNHEHEWQAHGLTEKTVELEGGFVRAKRTFAVQSCGCGEVRELFVNEKRWRPYA